MADGHIRWTGVLNVPSDVLLALDLAELRKQLTVEELTYEYGGQHVAREPPEPVKYEPQPPPFGWADSYFGESDVDVQLKEVKPGVYIGVGGRVNSWAARKARRV